MTAPVIAIVGRPNVGKSTLFNRIIRRKEAIVDAESGVTRDRNYARTDWCGQEFIIVDTGGYMIDFKNDIDRGIRFQVEEAISEADLVLFVVDVNSGITRDEQKIAGMLLKSGKPTLVAANKVDGQHFEAEAGAFMRLGFGEPHMISALHGTRTGDLLDVVVEHLPEASHDDEEDDAVSVAVLGRPNAGKSSLVNALIGRNKMLVTDIPGTTRDSIDSYVSHGGQKFRLIDTAGLRKRARVRENIEYYSTLRAVKSIERCQVAVIITDIAEGVSKQDLQIVDMAAEAQRGIILVLNKWDLVDKDDRTYDEMTAEIRRQLRGNDYVEIISTSALTKQRVHRLLDLCGRVFDEWNKKIDTNVLNKWLEQAVARNHPPSPKGKQVSIKYVTQTKASPPVFTFFANRPGSVVETYRRYLKNQLREAFGFGGVPVKLIFKKK